jgi:hypothetical protein
MRIDPTTSSKARIIAEELAQMLVGPVTHQAQSVKGKENNKINKV